jgi:hypothetical protein
MRVDGSYNRTDQCVERKIPLHLSGIVVQTVVQSSLYQAMQDVCLSRQVYSGYGGLVVSMLVSGTQDRGFETGTSRAKKSSACLPSHVADLRHVNEPYNLPWKSQIIG